MWSTRFRFFRSSAVSMSSMQGAKVSSKQATRLNRQHFPHRLMSASSTPKLIRMTSGDSDWRSSYFFHGLLGVGIVAAASCRYGLDSADRKTDLEAAIVLNDAVSTDGAEEEEEEDETTMLLNWSGTHAVHVANADYWEPETIQELQDIVKACHEQGKPIRPLGSALSPNGIGFHSGGMVSLANLDKIVKVDKRDMTVTVQAGARVSQVRLLSIKDTTNLLYWLNWILLTCVCI